MRNYDFLSISVSKVDLIGTCHKHLFTSPSGRKTIIVIKCKHSFNVCSMFSYSFYHMVGIRETMEFEKGQRFRLAGPLSSQNYLNEENKLRQKVIIKASEFELLPHDDKQLDRNHVELVKTCIIE